MAADRPRRLLWITTSLGTGGAEMMLYKLIAGLDRQRYAVQVVALLDLGAIGPRLQALGVPVVALGLQGAPTPAQLWRLCQVVRAFRPDVIQGWMYSGNVLAFVAHCLRPGVPWFTSIRQTLYDFAQEARITRWAIRLDARLSRRASANVYVARTAVAQHVAVGYAAERALTIGNGFASAQFRPDPAARQHWRQAWGIGPDTVVIGHVARYHPMKDHATLLRAAGLLAAAGRDLCFVLAGPDVVADNPPLAALVQASGASVRLLGEQRDTPALFAAFDLLVLSSARGEGFPNVVGEAMSCGVPCVVTDVGDSAWVVGESGAVVPPGDSAALAAALGRLLDLPPAERQALGVRARQRIETHFSIAASVRQYQALWAGEPSTATGSTERTIA